MRKKSTKKVNRNNKSDLEIESEVLATLGRTRYGYAYCIGMAIKYILRAGRTMESDTLTDLEIARGFLTQILQEEED